MLLSDGPGLREVVCIAASLVFVAVGGLELALGRHGSRSGSQVMQSASVTVMHLCQLSSESAMEDRTAFLNAATLHCA